MKARPDSLRAFGAAHPEHVHEVTIALHLSNMAEVRAMLLDRADPSSSRYQQWLTVDRVLDLVDNSQGHAAVLAWLHAEGVEVVPVANQGPRHHHFIHARAAVRVWDRLLATQFSVWRDEHPTSSLGRRGLSASAFLDPSSLPAQQQHHEGYLVLAEHYSVPAEVHAHISAVFHTCQAPFVMTGRAVVRPPVQRSPSAQGSDERRSLVDFQAVVSPYMLSQYYQIGSSITGSSTQTQAVFQTESGGTSLENMPFYSTSDLQTFMTKWGLPYNQPLNEPASPSFDTSKCSLTTSSGPNCNEGNLDLQYLMGLATKTRTVYWYHQSSPNPFVDWATAVYADLTGSKTLSVLVTSISFGATEQTIDGGSLNSFNDQATLLGIVGSTVLVATGDNGAVGHGTTAESTCSAQTCGLNSGTDANRGSWVGTAWSGKGYFPSFPATSPYVTAVGATMGPDIGLAEVACQSNVFYNYRGVSLGGVITTGGGFSTQFPMPSWQKTAVSAYMATVTASGKVPVAGYNPLGRAYPDVSLIGVRYSAIVGGAEASMYGTSASAPVFAAMVSLVNSLRLQKGKGPIGFLNPTLYQIGNQNRTFFKALNISGDVASIFTDITSGDNKCCMATDTNPTTPPSCCNSGFTAAVGWDPVTGWGSVPFTKFASIFSVAAPFIPAAPKGTAAVSDEIPVAQIITLILVLLAILGSVLMGIYYCVRKNPAARSCMGLPPIVTPAQFQNNQSQHQQQQRNPQQQEWEQRWDDGAGPGPTMATARYTGQGQGQGVPVMAHGFPQSDFQGGHRPVSVGPTSFARLSFPDPSPPYSQPYTSPSSGPPARTSVSAIYGFQEDGHMHPMDVYAQQAHPEGGSLERCPHCQMTFNDPVELVEHVQVCAVPDIPRPP